MRIPTSYSISSLQEGFFLELITYLIKDLLPLKNLLRHHSNQFQRTMSSAQFATFIGVFVTVDWLQNRRRKFLPSDQNINQHLQNFSVETFFAGQFSYLRYTFLTKFMVSNFCLPTNSSREAISERFDEIVSRTKFSTIRTYRELKFIKISNDIMELFTWWEVLPSAIRK